MNVNLNLGGLVQEAGKYYSSVKDAHRQEEIAKRQRAPHDNAMFVKAIADAVYCIKTDETPHVFTCSKEVMPNQFTMVLSKVCTLEEHFQIHQKIMNDALQRGFERVLILEPGVDLTNVPPLDQVENIPISGIAVLGGQLRLCESFIRTSNPLFQRGHAVEATAVLVTAKFMQKMIDVDRTFLCMTTDEFYNFSPNALCMVPPAFEKTQTNTSDKIWTKITNVYRSYTDQSIEWVLWSLAIILVVLFLIYILS